ncbi:uncharacterized protein SPPG_08688 [Spizellomyces punctatus DAOM BR117]|uniref:Aldose 1-epimerase n=1 Tax=Spizellomyces punctatus (strain DAOM BR117) TaxID=645134 RepID=A0A0L0H391_SPIPD|nr:uncharacterized protein SPPG_08688 [Spizellomyces punctatus DAOM BR117]KNC95935.1 hypothetical protein SPPG_08688 [Spizellomyces punctatus DAOM BR117]|eukprot:XP_016603975.1 hypothetical protein SPPG_08688 [Spizellomyces punctatus DAOM BR117]
MPIKQTVVPGVPEDIQVFELFTQSNSLSARCINYGARLTHLMVPDKDGKYRDVLLGFDDPTDYVTVDAEKKTYFGATIGRTCNRITHGHFFLNNRDYNLPINDPPNNLHGGVRGFDKRYWRPTILVQDPPTLRFEYTSADGEEGYPGEVHVSVTYTLAEYHLVIDHTASLTEGNPENLQTVINLTAHPYFNLSGCQEEPDVTEHIVEIPDAVGYLEVTENKVPSGRLVRFDQGDPALNLTTPKPLREGLSQLTHFRGYDHFYLLRDKPAAASPNQISNPAARVTSPTTGIVLELRTDAAGFQLYTGNNLDGSISGKASSQGDNVIYKRYAGLALEPSAPVDAVNHPPWRDTVVIGKGQEWRQSLIYGFSTVQRRPSSGMWAV